jgi:hypothetical protein
VWQLRSLATGVCHSSLRREVGEVMHDGSLQESSPGSAAEPIAQNFPAAARPYPPPIIVGVA